MEAADLIALAKAYEQNRAFITNEETSKMALIVPFLRALGYEPNNPREVRAEFTAPFTQGDGKRLPDRMDYAVFDKEGTKPLFVVEAKPLGSDLKGCSNQLARYIAQLPDLHFGILTDGCKYLLYGDLDSPNVMDSEPFFTVSLDDPKTDWVKAARFLEKFRRDKFDATTLVADAENSRYRIALSAKLRTALTDPSKDEAFMRWLTEGVYTGKRTSGVMERLGRLAKESIEPAIMAVMSESFVDSLKSRLGAHPASPSQAAKAAIEEAESLPAELMEESTEGSIITTDEEIALHRFCQAICERAGIDPALILYRDSRSYFSVSYRRPTKWFLRFFSRETKKYILTRIPPAEVPALARGFTTKEVANGCQIVLTEVAQVWALEGLVLRSLQILETAGEKSDSE